MEWGTDYDIKVNGIAPGPIGDTPGMSKLVPEEIDSSSKSRDYMPLYKLGEKWDIAMAAVYLASDAGQLCYDLFFSSALLFCRTRLRLLPCLLLSYIPVLLCSSEVLVIY